MVIARQSARKRLSTACRLSYQAQCAAGPLPHRMSVDQLRCTLVACSVANGSRVEAHTHAPEDSKIMRAHCDMADGRHQVAMLSFQGKILADC